MSTLVIDPPRRSRLALKTTLVYMAVAMLCIIIDNIYALFGHGIRSDAMSLMFLFPLLGGALPFFLLWFGKADFEPIKARRFFYNVFNSGIAALTVSSMLQGVFDIAGTASVYLIVFNVCGWAMVATGILGCLFNLLRRPQ